MQDVTVLCTGCSGGDLAMPGFANMVQGELHAPPDASRAAIKGVCAASMAALQHAASTLELSEHGHALVAASEMPSRMFKRSRFAPRGYDTDFDSHFLRWMLSDGAGACLLSKQPRTRGPVAEARWIHNRSFSGDLPVCMQIGQPSGAQRPVLSRLSVAGRGGSRRRVLCLRQDIRLLPHLFELGIHEYVELVRRAAFRPEQIDHFLCHYSSQKFARRGRRPDARAGLSIPTRALVQQSRPARQHRRGVDLHHARRLLRERELKPGQRILCFVPESGRFTSRSCSWRSCSREARPHGRRFTSRLRMKPRQPQLPPHAAQLIQELASVWHDYRRAPGARALIRKITDWRSSRSADYVRWMACWIPQVRDGSHWMRRRPSNLERRSARSQSLVRKHAGEERNDYEILFDDYRLAGGTAGTIDELRRNPGGEALNAFMHALASQPIRWPARRHLHHRRHRPAHHSGAVAAAASSSSSCPPQAFRFLSYHGENDVTSRALAAARWRWRSQLSPGCEQQIVDVARATPRALPPADGARACEHANRNSCANRTIRSDPSPWLALYLDQSVPLAENQARLARGSRARARGSSCCRWCGRWRADDRRCSSCSRSCCRERSRPRAAASTARMEHEDVAVAEREPADLAALPPGLGDPGLHCAQRARRGGDDARRSSRERSTKSATTSICSTTSTCSTS